MNSQRITIQIAHILYPYHVHHFEIAMRLRWITLYITVIAYPESRRPLLLRVENFTRSLFSGDVDMGRNHLLTCSSRTWWRIGFDGIIWQWMISRPRMLAQAYDYHKLGCIPTDNKIFIIQSLWSTEYTYSHSLGICTDMYFTLMRVTKNRIANTSGYKKEKSYCQLW